MKAYTFTMNGHVYFSPTMQEALNFLSFWVKESNDLITPFQTRWKIKRIERAPKWVPESLKLNAQIEYGK